MASDHIYGLGVKGQGQIYINPSFCSKRELLFRFWSKVYIFTTMFAYGEYLTTMGSVTNLTLGSKLNDKYT